MLWSALISRRSIVIFASQFNRGYGPGYGFFGRPAQTARPVRSFVVRTRQGAENMTVSAAMAWYGEGAPSGLTGALRSAVLDHEHLRRQTMGDDGLGAEVLAMFLDQSAVLLRAVREAQGPRMRSDAAHTLKGSARAVGAFAVAETAHLVEMLAVESSEDAVLDAVARLHADVAEARSAIAAKLHGGTSPGL